MAISSRVVKNKRDKDGKLTGRPGTAYDINVKYKTANGYKAFVKRGFATRAQAAIYEAEIKVKFTKSHPLWPPYQKTENRPSKNILWIGLNGMEKSICGRIQSTETKAIFRTI